MLPRNEMTLPLARKPTSFREPAEHRHFAQASVAATPDQLTAQQGAEDTAAY